MAQKDIRDFFFKKRAREEELEVVEENEAGIEAVAERILSPINIVAIEEEDEAEAEADTVPVVEQSIVDQSIQKPQRLPLNHRFAATSPFGLPDLNIFYNFLFHRCWTDPCKTIT